MFIEIQELCTIIQWLYRDTQYMNKLHNNNNVYNYIHHTLKIINNNIGVLRGGGKGALPPPLKLVKV